MNSSNYTRRHSRFHEKILLSFLFQFIIGGILLILLSVVPKWGIYFWKTIDLNSTYVMYGNIISFGVCLFILRNLFRFPGSQSSAYIFPTVLAIYGVLILVFLVNRFNYSNLSLLIGFLTVLFWCYVGYFIGNRYRINRYAIVPFGDIAHFQNIHNAFFVVLKEPDLKEERFNAIIADLHSKKLTPEWEKFLAKCILSRIPVYHTQQIKESLTGRVKIDHLSENEFGSLLPSNFYENLKRIIDVLAAIVLLPILIPFFIAIGILIRLESKGSIFFLQKRMGFRGKPFTMLKFRSMYIEKKGKGFTDKNQDPRITRIGKYIRKFRIDELPQVFNILIGQMSFIGPRPESLELSNWYEKDVPFFSYRHVVRPGISGWAQVEQGYAAEVEGMNIKLEYDFYYIKHFSFWLDTLITFKTIKTILTGFGAR
ncbi:MAG: sugar transferase [Leptospiraceae bacterium]|nr:sugar transferase [Leptospiraceae bacterium]